MSIDLLGAMLAVILTRGMVLWRGKCMGESIRGGRRGEGRLRRRHLDLGIAVLRGLC
jgi:hypothetical protein